MSNTVTITADGPFDDMSAAIKRVGNSAQEAGVAFEDLLKLVQIAQDQTARSGTAIGNALKTVFTRISQPYSDKLLASLGIKVGANAIDTLRNIAKKYPNMSTEDKNRVAELLGGIYQINIIKSLFKELS